MTRLPRVKGKIFASNADANDIGQFGSALAGNKLLTSDIATIQDLPAYETGWRAAVLSTRNYPTLQEMNGLQKVFSQQIAYNLQSGIPEWDSETTYYSNQFCSVAGNIYVSLVDNNLDNNPATDDGTNWDAFLGGSGGGGIIGNYANQDLNNLTELGNARFYYNPFSINNGTVTSGENTTLITPGGSQTAINYSNPYIQENGTFGGNSFAVTCDKTLSRGYLYYLFNGDTSDIVRWYNVAAVNVDVYFPSPVLPETVSIQVIKSSSVGYPPRYVTLYGSNDYSTWTDLGTVTTLNAANNSIHTITPSGSTYYRYLRFYIYCTGQTAAGAYAQGTFREITIKGKTIIGSAGSTIICKPCTISTCDGRISVFEGEFSIDVSNYSNGKYYIFKDYNSGELSLTNSFSIGKTNPSNTTYWLDTSILPANLKINNIVNNDLVKIGRCTISSGTIIALDNNEFNMNGYFELFNLPDFDNKISLSSGTSYTAEIDGWLVTTSEVVKPIYFGEIYTASSGQYFAPMKGY